MNMNSQPESENLSKPFSKPEKRFSFSIGLIVAVVGLLALLIYYFSDQSEVATLKQSEQTEEHQEAAAQAEKARRKELIAYLQQHPDDEFAHFQLGQLIQDRAPFQALENYSHVTSRHPRYYEAVEAIAEIAREQDLPDKAKPALLILVRKYPEERRFHEQLARLFFNAGKYDRALKYANRSIELGANQAANYLLVANILRQAGRTSEMVGPLKEVLFLEPDLYEAHLNLAYAALYTGDLKTAEREASWCLEQRPDSSTALRYLAIIDRNQGKVAAALSHVEQALQADPQDFESLLLKADLLIYQRSGQQAYDLLKPLYSAHQTDRRFVSALARAAGLIGKREEALQLQRQNQSLIKEDDLKPSSLQSESIEKTQSPSKR
ncbi:Tetratricopeptide repeat protein [Gimesia fumaroli]|uniref:Tetratricopeptide repeat protein n=2 Tax=Gimesia fumaroli TaxID=2527976 RepID=A0A518IED9_9PLAN|nr:Tetratricopeptide repeat protein [Gimesia fumaroli]